MLTTIKVNWYKLLIAAVLITAIVVCTFRACNHGQPALTSSSKGEVIPKQIPKSYKKPSGTVHTETKVVQAEHDFWLDQYYQSLLKGARDSLKITQDQLKEVIAAGVTSDGSYTLPLKPDTVLIHDTLSPARIFKYQNRFISLAGRIDQDSIDIAYKSFDSLTFITYTKKKNIFSPRELYLNAFSMNPNSSIKGLQSVKLTVPPPKWAIGINAGYYFDGNSFKPGIGIGITKTLIRW